MAGGLFERRNSWQLREREEGHLVEIPLGKEKIEDSLERTTSLTWWGGGKKKGKPVTFRFSID